MTMEASASYSLRNQVDVSISTGEGTAQLYTDNLTILPRFGDVLSFSYRSIDEFHGEDYKISISFSTKEKLVLFNIGLRYEDFLRNLVKLRNELILRDMLINEKMRQPTARCVYSLVDATGKGTQNGECELRIYETALAILPDMRDPIRIPLSDIVEFTVNDYQVNLVTEFGDRFTVTQMGRLFDPFTKALSDANTALQQKVVTSLMKLLPTSDPTEIRRAARLMKEGRAARKLDIESISQTIWPQLEKRLSSLAMDEEYAYLKDLSRKDRICIGVKEGLTERGESQYLWFLIPIYGTDPGVPGNAIAMEASSSEGTGRATYFFRVTRREIYRNPLGLDDLNRRCDEVIRSINRAMIEINFRREPVYLSEERLLEPKYQRYLFAVKRLQALKMLRELFIGRVSHISPDQWKSEVQDVLRFNVSTIDDAAKWSKTTDKGQ